METLARHCLLSKMLSVDRSIVDPVMLCELSYLESILSPFRLLVPDEPLVVYAVRDARVLHRVPHVHGERVLRPGAVHALHARHAPRHARRNSLRTWWVILALNH